MTKLFKKEIQKIVDQIVINYAPEKVILFGSIANGCATGNSDIDMLIVKNTNDRFIDRIEKVLQSCDYKTPLEPLVYNPVEIKQRIKMGDPFIRDILKYGRTIYTKKP